MYVRWQSIINPGFTHIHAVNQLVMVLCCMHPQQQVASPLFKRFLNVAVSCLGCSVLPATDQVYKAVVSQGQYMGYHGDTICVYALPADDGDCQWREQGSHRRAAAGADGSTPRHSALADKQRGKRITSEEHNEVDGLQRGAAETGNQA